MKEKNRSFLEKIENIMACVAYAEAGENCPLDYELNENKKIEVCRNSVMGTMACSAYAEAGVPCPICDCP